MRRILSILLVFILLINNLGYAATNVWDSEALQELEEVTIENAEGYVENSNDDDQATMLGGMETELKEESGLKATLLKIILWIPEYVFNAAGEVIYTLLPSITGIIFGTEKLVQINYFTLGSGSSMPTGGSAEEAAAAAISNTAELYSFSAGMYDFVTKLYYAFNYFAIICFVVIIAYLAVRMLLSALGKQKAVYKALIKNWFVGLILLFVGPFIMAYTIWISNILTTLVYNVGVDLVSGESSLFGIEGTAAANVHSIIPAKVLESGAVSLLVPVVGPFIAVGSILVYLGIVLLVFWTYLKRLLIVTYLMILYPFITVTYVFDKMGDRKAQTFQKWFHEFAANVFIQPFHALTLLLLLAFISAAPGLFIIPAVGSICIAFLLFFLLKGEKLFKDLFQLNSSMGGASLGQSMGDFAKGVSAVNSVADLTDKGTKAAAGLKLATEDHKKTLEKLGVLDKKGRIDDSKVSTLDDKKRSAFNQAQEELASAKRKSKAFTAGLGTSAFALGASGGQLASSLSLGRGVNDTIDKTLNPKLKAHSLDMAYRDVEEAAGKNYADMNEEEKSKVGARMKALNIPEAKWQKMSAGRRKELMSSLKDAEKARAVLGEDVYKDRLSKLPLGTSTDYDRKDDYTWDQDKNHTYIYKGQGENAELVGINNNGDSSLQSGEFSKRRSIAETDMDRRKELQAEAHGYAEDEMSHSKLPKNSQKYKDNLEKMEAQKLESLIKGETAALSGFSNLQPIKKIESGLVDEITKMSCSFVQNPGSNFEFVDKDGNLGSKEYPKSAQRAALQLTSAIKARYPESASFDAMDMSEFIAQKVKPEELKSIAHGIATKEVRTNYDSSMATEFGPLEVTRPMAQTRMPRIDDLDEVKKNPGKFGIASADAAIPSSELKDELASFTIGAISTKANVKAILSADSAKADLKTAFAKDVIVTLKKSHDEYQNLSNDEFIDKLKKDANAMLEFENLAANMAYDSKNQTICASVSKIQKESNARKIKLIYDVVPDSSTDNDENHILFSGTSLNIPAKTFDENEPLTVTATDNGTLVVASLKHPEKDAYVIHNSGYSSGKGTTTDLCGFIDTNGTFRVSNANFGVTNYSSVYTPPTGEIYYQLDEEVNRPYSEISTNSAAEAAIYNAGGYAAVKIVRQGSYQIIQKMDTGEVIYTQDGLASISTPAQEIHFDTAGNISSMQEVEKESIVEMKQSLVNKRVKEVINSGSSKTIDPTLHEEAERLDLALANLKGAKKAAENNVMKKRFKRTRM